MILFLICEQIYKTKVVSVGYHYGVKCKRPMERSCCRTYTFERELRLGERYPIDLLDVKKVPAGISHFKIVLEKHTCSLDNFDYFSKASYRVRQTDTDSWHAEAVVSGVTYVICEDTLLDTLECVAGVVRDDVVLLLIQGGKVVVIPATSDALTDRKLFALMGIDVPYDEYMSAGVRPKGVHSVGEMIELASTSFPTFEYRDGHLHICRTKVGVGEFYCKGWKGAHHMSRLDSQHIMRLQYKSKRAPRVWPR